MFGVVWRWFPAVVTAGFVMAGFMKEAEALAGLPVDLTLALAVLTAGVVVVRVVISGVPRVAHGVVLAYCLLLPPVLWSATTEYGADKVTRLMTFTFLAILAPVVLIRDPRDVLRHVVALTGMCGLVVLNGLLNPQLSSDYEGAPVRTDAVNTIGLGAAAGTVLVVFSLGLIWKRIPVVPALVGAGTGLYMLLQSGSRGPLFSAILAVLGGSLLTRQRPDHRRVVGFLGLLAVGVLVAYSAAPLASQRRILALLQGNTGGSVDGRIRLYDEALDSINHRPFGLGWGGFEGIAFAAYRWPHNLPLEVLVEAGVVFGGLFLVWMYLQVIRTRRITVDYVGAAAFAVLLFWLGASMVSSDFNNNRVGLYALGVAIAAGSLIRPPGPRETVPTGPAPAGRELATASPGAVAVERRS
jgi:hypothetical protein